ncbi:MAG: mechanosensitive ion channel family protein [Faecousia sp.]
MEKQKETVSTEAPQKKEIKNPLKKFKLPQTRKKRVIFYLVAIVLILVVTNPGLIPFLPNSVSNTLTNAMSGLFGNVEQISKVISFSWVKLFQLVIMIMLLMIIREGANWALERYNPAANRAKTIKNLLCSTLKYLIALVGVLWGLSILGVNIATLFAGVGIVALIIGFGAESMIADVVTGLFMIFENQYNVGDIIELDGYRGTVVSIAIRTTSIMDTGGNVKIFNNSDVRNIVNLSSESSYAICDIGIPYEADIDKAEAVIAKIAEEMVKEYPDVFATAPVCKGVQQLADSAVVMRVVAPVKEEDRFDAARMMNKELKMGLEKAGMGVPYNKLVVQKES